MLWPIQVMALLTRADLVARNRGERTAARARAAAGSRPALGGPWSLARPRSPFFGVPALLRVRRAQGSQEAGRPNDPTQSIHQRARRRRRHEIPRK